MENTNKLLKNKKIQKLLDKLHLLEDDRIYCRHDLVHFFDVARIFYILCLENDIKINKDLAYTAGLLHDLGRCEEYTNGTPHDIASYDLAKEILKETSYSKEEKDLICSLIASHRKKTDENSLENLFYKADKLSRDCFNCRRQDTCKWLKKNQEISY